MPTPASSIYSGNEALWSIVDNVVQQAISFLVFLVLARLVTPHEFGVVAVVHVAVTFFRQTVLDALVLPVSRAGAATDELYSWALGICVLSSLVMAAAMVILTPWMATWVNMPELGPVLPWMAVAVMAYGASAAYEARLVRKMAFRSLAIRSVISVASGGIVGIALALRGSGVMALVAQQVTSSCVALALLMLQSRWRPRPRWSTMYWRMFSPDVSRLSGAGFLGFLASQGDTVLVSIMLGAQATGIYSFAKRLTSSIYLAIGSSLLKLAIPAFAIASPDPNALRAHYIRILGMTLLLMLPMLGGLSILIEQIIRIFFGDIWRSAAPVVALLSVMYLLLAVNQLNDYLLYAMRIRFAPMQRALIQIILSVLLGFAGAQFGLAWMAAGFALAAIAVWPLNQHMCNGFLHQSFHGFLYRSSAPVIATTAMITLLWFLLPTLNENIDGVTGDYSAIWLGAWIAFGGAVYITAQRLVVWVLPNIHDATPDIFIR